jgi:hypothetical protein
MTKRLAEKLVEIAESDREFLDFMRELRSRCEDLFHIKDSYILERKYNYSANKHGFSNRNLTSFNNSSESDRLFILDGLAGSVAQFINRGVENGLLNYNHTAAGRKEFESTIEPTDQEIISIHKPDGVKPLLDRTYEDFPKYSTPEWTIEYFENSIKSVFDWELDLESLEQRLIKLRNSHYHSLEIDEPSA